jgi:hypothetical protein
MAAHAFLAEQRLNVIGKVDLGRSRRWRLSRSKSSHEKKRKGEREEPESGQERPPERIDLRGPGIPPYYPPPPVSRKKIE